MTAPRRPLAAMPPVDPSASNRAPRAERMPPRRGAARHPARAAAPRRPPARAPGAWRDGGCSSKRQDVSRPRTPAVRSAGARSRRHDRFGSGRELRTTSAPASAAVTTSGASRQRDVAAHRGARARGPPRSAAGLAEPSTAIASSRDQALTRCSGCITVAKTERAFESGAAHVGSRCPSSPTSS